MTVEDQRNENDVSSDRFPVGMRVLAVDDDPICLKVLESLLRKCQYQVTTTNQAIKALKMLRENRNMVDLVISDVNMPDMDGFKLLELVGLEMDLPVIMLSAHSDTKLVMKGITHGACDYLLKPVRVEELKNIWQHVVRRKKSDPKNQGKSAARDRASVETSEGGNRTGSTGNYDQSAKSNRKRKDQDEDEEEDSEDDGRENEDPGTQKKPRIVWSTDLHKKFVDAVQQLGYDKAFPKKILDMMNVEGLTRENVASHLQKYRQFLKRLDAAERQKASGALGVKEFSFMRMSGPNHGDLGDLRSLTQPLRLANAALSPSVSHVGMLGRLNSPGGLTMRGITSATGMTQPTNSFNTTGKFQPSLLANQAPSLFQAFPSSLELSKFQVPQTKSSNPLAELNALNSNNNNNNNNNNNPTGFGSLSGFQGTKAAFSSSNDVPMILQGNSQPTTIGRGALGIQSLVRPAPTSLQSRDFGICGSTNFLNHDRCNEPWQSAVQSSTFASTALPITESSSRGQMQSNNLVAPSTGSQFGNSPLGFSSTSALSALADSRDVQGRDGLIGNVISGNNFTTRQTWEGGFNNSDNLDRQFSAFSSLSPSVDHNNACNKDSTASIFDQLNGCSTSIFPRGEMEKSATEAITMKPNEDNNLLSQGKAHETLIPNYESLDDILNSLMKRDQNETALMSGDFGLDNYPLGSCM